MEVFKSASRSAHVPKILLVEDDPDDAVLFRHSLSEEYDLYIAKDGDEAIATAEKQRPNIIFLDMNLPRKSGLEVCEILRKHADSQLAQTPIVFVSAQYPDGFKETVQSLGGDYFMKKPLKPDEIINEIKTRLPYQYMAGHKNKTNRILCIEDDVEDQMFLNAFIEKDKRQSYEVVNVPNLDMALNQLKTKEFDLILMDLNLPGSKGLETFYAVRDCANGKPILVLTGQGDELMAEAAIHEGAQDFILKNNLSTDVISRAIRYAIERHSIQQNRHKPDLG